MSVTAEITVCVTTIFGACMLILVAFYTYLVNGLITEIDRKVSRDGEPQTYE